MRCDEEKVKNRDGGRRRGDEMNDIAGLTHTTTRHSDAQHRIKHQAKESMKYQPGQ